MRFFASASALLAMATAAIAQTADFNPVYRPSDSEEVPAGTTFDIVWSAPAKYAAGTVSIHLIGGADQASLVPLADIASGVANSDESYPWNVDASLGSETIYGLIFRLESDPTIFQYSQPFSITPSTDDGGEHTTTTDGHVIITTATGTMTVTISSCLTSETETPIVSSTFAPNTTSIETSTSIWVTSTMYPNETSTYVAPTLPPPTIIEPPAPTNEVPEVPPPSSTPSDVPESSAARFGSGVLAVAGGLAIAMLL